MNDSDKKLQAATEAYFREGMSMFSTPEGMTSRRDVAVYACGILECVQILVRREDVDGLRRLFTVACEVTGAVTEVEYEPL